MYTLHGKTTKLENIILKTPFCGFIFKTKLTRLYIFKGKTFQVI